MVEGSDIAMKPTTTDGRPAEAAPGADTRRNDTRNLPRRLSPLDGRYATGPGVVLTPLPPRERISLRASSDAFGVVAGALGFDLPQRPRTSATSAAGTGHHVGGTSAALWLGPDEWLVLGPDASNDDATSMMPALAALEGVSAVDVSHRNLALRVEGPAAEAVIAAGCPQDLRLDRFPVGACSRTVLTKAEIVLWRTGEVRASRSSAGALSPTTSGLSWRTPRGPRRCDLCVASSTPRPRLDPPLPCRASPSQGWRSDAAMTCLISPLEGEMGGSPEGAT